MSENKNLIIAVGLSMAILFGFQYFYEAPKIRNAEIRNAATRNAAVVSGGTDTNVLPNSKVFNSNQKITEEPAEGDLPASPPRVTINTPKVKGSVNLAGAYLDDLSLVTYHETTDPKSPEITLLNPKSSKKAYFIEMGWRGAANFPNANAIWKLKNKSQSELGINKPIILSWSRGEGVDIERTIAVDENYLFTITDRVTNNTGNDLQLKAFSKVTRLGKPITSGYYILHEGAVGVLNRRLKELDYDSLLKDGRFQETTTGGWLGFTDKYWLVALIPHQKTPVLTTFSGQAEGQTFCCQVEYEMQTLKPGQTLEQTQYAFAGAKVLSLLDGYERKLGFDKFDLAVDFGWFYFLTKPLFYALEFCNKLLGNLGLAILLLTVAVKVVFFPLANKSFRSMAKMKMLAPKIEQLKQQYSHDKMRLNQELMQLYRKEKANPVSGCLPMLIQAPIFFCLYKVFFVTIEMRHAPFYGWIHDLSAPDPTSIFNLFGLLPWSPPGFLMIGILPLFMGLTMLLQQRLNPAPTDPVQAKMMLIMPILFTYLFASFPAGLVIYWAWSNVLTIIQQWVMMRQTAKQSARKANDDMVEVIPPKKSKPR